MAGRRFEHLLVSVGAMRHPCDLDLLLFFHRHPRAILTSDRLSAYVGYDVNQLARSLDTLSDAGLLTRSQNPTHTARLYVLKTPETGWLASVLEIASTREGRESLLCAMKDAAAVAATNTMSPRDDDASPSVRARPKTLVAR